MSAKGAGCDWDWRALRAISVAEIRRVLGHDGAVEDATQETLIRAWRKRGSCRTPNDPGPWIRVIARREALRVATRRAEEALVDDVDATLGVQPDASRAIAAIDLERALDALAAAEREVVVMRYGQDLTQLETARRLRIPPGTARVRLYRGRAHLRQLLQGYGG